MAQAAKMSKEAFEIIFQCLQSRLCQKGRCNGTSEKNEQATAKYIKGLDTDLTFSSQGHFPSFPARVK
jgi:hypothetical protein